MIKLAKKIYSTIVPYKFRKTRSERIEKKIKSKIKSRILEYYSQVNKESINFEIKNALEYISNYELEVMPYSFLEKYNAEEVNIKYDSIRKLHYVLFSGKKMFFPSHMKPIQIRNYYNKLLQEQDPESPHAYLTDDFSVNFGDVVVDLGAAEGNFSLSVVEKVSELYIFEGDELWCEALEATFYPWNDKVHIIKKFVSNIDQSNFIKLDTFFYNKTVNFIKMDIEGYELRAIHGAINTIQRSKELKISVCTYHKKDDETEISCELDKLGFSTEFSKGYMLFYYDKSFNEPFFRRGLIRANKIIKG